MPGSIFEESNKREPFLERRGTQGGKDPSEARKPAVFKRYQTAASSGRFRKENINSKEGKKSTFNLGPDVRSEDRSRRRQVDRSGTSITKSLHVLLLSEKSKDGCKKQKSFSQKIFPLSQKLAPHWRPTGERNRTFHLVKRSEGAKKRKH